LINCYYFHSLPCCFELTDIVHHAVLLTRRNSHLTLGQLFRDSRCLFHTCDPEKPFSYVHHHYPLITSDQSARTIFTNYILYFVDSFCTHPHIFFTPPSLAPNPTSVKSLVLSVDHYTQSNILPAESCRKRPHLIYTTNRMPKGIYKDNYDLEIAVTWSPSYMRMVVDKESFVAPITRAWRLR